MWGITTWLLVIAALIVLGVVAGILFWNRIVPHSYNSTEIAARNVAAEKTMSSSSSELMALQEEYRIFVRQKEIMMAKHMELAIEYKKKNRSRNEVLQNIKLLIEKKQNLQKEKNIKFPLIIGGIRCHNEAEYELFLSRLDRIIETSKLVAAEYEKDLETISCSLEQIEPASIAVNKRLAEIKRAILSSQVCDDVEVAFLLLSEQIGKTGNNFDINRIEQELQQLQKR